MNHQERCKHGCRNEPAGGCDLPACLHADVDQLGPCCLSCGRIKRPKIEYIIVVGACLYFLAQMVRWAMVGFEVIR